MTTKIMNSTREDGKFDGSQVPPLLDATIEQLHDGLVTGWFTSVDLVNVRRSKIAACSQKTNNIGLYCSHQRG